MRVRHLTPVFKYKDGSMDLHFQFLMEQTETSDYWTSILATVNADFEVVSTSYRNDTNLLKDIQEELEKQKMRVLLRNVKNRICINNGGF